MNQCLLTLGCACLFILNTVAQTPLNHTYETNTGPDKNPMKGWNSGWWNDFEFSSVGFQYLKWNQFEPTDDNFNFDAIEDVINRPGTQGRHIIIRLYTDWFGQEAASDGGPEWLYQDYGVERFQDDGKYITNYNHVNYLSEVTEAIQVLANYLDNDPRIYAIQLGVLGYWGEWHTFSFNGDFEIADATRTEILNVYKNNFSRAQLMGRYPWREPLASENTIGYHNDFFKPNNGHSDEFDEAIFEGDKWLSGPVGGEIPPIDDDEQEAFMTDLYETSAGSDMIDTGHYSTMQVGGDIAPCENNPNSNKCEGFLDLHRKMGYNFQIASALFPETLTQLDNLDIELNLLNIGVAPMYYDWDMQFALLNDTNEAVEIFNTSYDITTLLPSEEVYSISISNGLDAISEGTYQLGLRLIQPNADENKALPWELDARNTYVLFSNELPVINGTWNNDNALIGGWSILGQLSIDNATLGINTLLENSISMYPNPSNKELNIVTNETLTLQNVQVYDMTGRLITTYPLNTTTTINISNLANGIYNIIINSEQGAITKRFIKY